MNNTKKINSNLNIFLSSILIILVLSSLTLLGGAFYIKGKLSKIKTIKIPNKPEQVSANKIKNDDGITNILIIGIDSKDTKRNMGRSNSVSIFTIDKNNKKLKLTSILGDSLVNIEGHGNEKIINANNYGGEALDIKTVNQNYSMNILDFIQIDFSGIEKVVENIGGINLNITNEEITYVNSNIDEINNIEHKKVKHIEKAGYQNINGVQALAYSRIKYLGANFQRTERQRTVLVAAIEKLGSKNKKDIPQIIDKIAPYLKTNLSTDKIMKVGSYILLHKMTNVEQSQIPYDGMYNDAVVNGMNVLVWNKNITIEKLHNYIFGSNK